jgi:hypothetical protein
MGKNVVGSAFWLMGRKFIQQKYSLVTPSLFETGAFV